MNRIEGRDKVTGRARYAFEYPAESVAYAYPVQSEIARGRILSFDLAAARAMPGVLAVLSGDEPPELGSEAELELALFSGHEVAYRGQIVAAVVADTLEAARAAAREQSGIRLADQPTPLYQLLVLATLLSARISGDIAVAAARELFTAGYRTPRTMTSASWQDRVDALGRGHYRRYDERAATMLGASADLALSRWRGDLRRLRDEAGSEAARIAGLLTEFPGIGPAGADIFLREVQAVWPGVTPHLDQRVLDGAAKVGLSPRPGPLRKAASRAAGSSSTDQKLAGLAAALVRVATSDRAAREVAAAASG